MSAAMAFDPTEVLREAVASLVAAHIEAMLAVRKLALIKGTASTTAKAMIRGWSPRALQFFWLMAKQKYTENFPSKSGIAKSIRWTERSLSNFWNRTLAKASIAVRSEESKELVVRIFRRKRERKFSGDGIALFLGLNQPSYAAIRRITETTAGIMVAFRDNHEGACEVAEANESLSEDERAAPRRSAEIREESVVAGPQLTLVI